VVKIAQTAFSDWDSLQARGLMNGGQHGSVHPPPKR
jgi:hypothetical protein